MSTHRTVTRALLLGTVAAGVLCAADSLARPGGGHSFSSGSHSFGGHSSFSSHSSFGSSSSGYHSYSSHSGGGDLTTLVVRHPWFGIPFVALVLGFIIYSKYQEYGGGWDSGSSSFDDSVWDPNPQPPPRTVPVSGKLTALRTVGPAGQGPFDPAFSLVVFEDFVYALYARAQQARDGRLDELAPWVSEQGRQLIQRDTTPVEVGTVVIGAMKYLRVTPLLSTSEWIHVTLEFEANYTERLVDGREHSYYVVDRWRLSRRTSAKSRPPDRVRAFDCPNCGAASTELRGDTCAHCGAQVGAGRFDWVVSSVELVRRDERGPQLTGDVEEVGTDFPTIVAPEAPKRLRRLETEDVSFNWRDFEKRVRLVFQEMYDAWSSREWLKARPYLSDNLFQMQSYWVDAYKRAGLTNQLTDLVVSEVELARVVRDPYFDSITVRVRASGVDITVADRTGRIVSGNRGGRRWTEYWTFIRGVGVQGKVTTEKKCPNCGAALQINMAGNCEYCQAKVTSGQFDWVLSRIEQDETYAG